MTFDVLLLKQADGGYSGRPALWPDLVAHGATEQEALEQIRMLIADRLRQTQFVQVEVDVPQHQANNSWLAKAGMFKHDPTWDSFLKAMADYRQSLDEERASELA